MHECHVTLGSVAKNNGMAFKSSIGCHGYLFEEEVVGQVIQHHGVAGVNGVGPREELHTIFDGVGLLAVEL